MKDAKNQIIFIGDIHGNYSKLNYDIGRYNHRDSYLFILGDVGVGFHKPNYYKTEFSNLNKQLIERNIHLYAGKGNHDNPDYFRETNNPFDLSNITLLKDYSELNLLSQNILWVGGAISIDRAWRIKENEKLQKHGDERRLWWPDEVFVYQDDFDYKKYDIVATHTRPANCGAFKGFDNIKIFLDGDGTLKEELIQESMDMEKLWDKTKPKYWYFAHFHQSLVTEYEGTVFRCLNIDEHFEHRIEK
jgi:hypothetical protein